MILCMCVCNVCYVCKHGVEIASYSIYIKIHIYEEKLSKLARNISILSI